MTTLTVMLGDYPHTRPLATGEIPVSDVDARFRTASPVYSAFPRMVRDLEFDVCELALATYLQAREAGVPVTLLPVVLVGGSHHGSLTRPAQSPLTGPRQLVGQRVGVRAYSQTTGMWVRGILREEYGIESSDITWVTTEEPHVAQYREPGYVRRSSATSVADLIRGKQVAAAVLGPRAVGGQGGGLVPVIADPPAAARAWIDRHATVPVNHLVVVRDEVLRSSPDAVAALFRALRDAIASTASERDDSAAGRAVAAGWSDELVRCLEIATRYALEQEVVRSRIDVARIVRDVAFLDA